MRAVRSGSGSHPWIVLDESDCQVLLATTVNIAGLHVATARGFFRTKRAAAAAIAEALEAERIAEQADKDGSE